MGNLGRVHTNSIVLLTHFAGFCQWMPGNFLTGPRLQTKHVLIFVSKIA